MFSWVYDKTTHRWLYGGPYAPVFDKNTQGLCVLDIHPDRRLEHYDGNGGSRAATAEEISAYDDAQKTIQADQLDTALAIQALGKIVLDRFDAFRTALNQTRQNPVTTFAPIPPIDPVKFWADVKAHYKNLLP